MRKLLSALLLAGLALPASAAAQDKQIASDTHVSQVYVLGTTVVYHRSVGRARLKRGWMAVVGGKRKQLKRIPRKSYIGDLGRDTHGRVVAPFGVAVPHSKRVRWYLYDVKRQRARRMRGFAGAGCRVDDVGVSGRRIAWTAFCSNGKKSGTFLRTGKHTRRLSRVEYDEIVIRGSSVAGIQDDSGNGDFAVHRLVSHGHVCPKQIPASYGSADHEWWPLEAFIAGSRIAWVMGSYGAVLGAKIGGPCGPAGKTGIYDFTPETSKIVSLAIDGNRLVYTDGKKVLSHKLGTPNSAPPANDDFEDATDIGSAAPQTIHGRTAHATLQEGEEPLDGNSLTVWYRWTAPANETIWVKPQTFGVSAGVFTGDGSSVGSLTRIPRDAYSGQFTRVDAQAGKTYWIAVASGPYGENYEPAVVQILTEQPPYD